MSNEEFTKWMAYFEKRPIGWREDQRTYQIMASFGTKEKPENLFESLRKMRTAATPAVEDGKLNVASFKGSLMFSKMMSAKGGDKIAYDN
ncbi:MAG: hypothetical protein OEX12_00140 [Gammaproteobacteria bacterium]|nr:hypothetical protein [Gammaproteobacteria bacterium]